MAQRNVCVHVSVCACARQCVCACVKPLGDKYSLCTCMMDGVSVLAISSVLQAVSGRLSELTL